MKVTRTETFSIELNRQEVDVLIEAMGNGVHELAMLDEPIGRRIIDALAKEYNK